MTMLNTPRNTGVGVLSSRRQFTGADGEPIELPPSSPLLFVLSGPAGVGKDTIFNKLRERDNSRHYAITVTTRLPRSNETNGVHYHFRSQEQLMQMHAAGEFLEWAEVYGNYFGTPVGEIRGAYAAKTDTMMKVDVQGAAMIKRAIPEAVLIFIGPSSYAELVPRLTGRKPETMQQRETRLEAARRALEARHQFDYMLVNRDGGLIRTVDDVENIIRTEKLRTQPPVYHIPSHLT
ncbi:MAG: guanylate kinase [Dehalococcoidia bacterium]|nr:guanylate kinase [Dehalococcoidia bacterium]